MPEGAEPNKFEYDSGVGGGGASADAKFSETTPLWGSNPLLGIMNTPSPSEYNF